MKKTVALIFIVSFFISCKKDVTSVPAEKRMKTEKYTYEEGSIAELIYTIDKSGKPATRTEGHWKTVYDYTKPGKIIYLSYTDDKLISENEFILNERELAISRAIKKVNGGFTDTYTYSYDTEGYMTSLTCVFQASTVRYEYDWKDGLRVRTRVYSNNIYTGKTEYSYDTKIPYKGDPHYFEIPHINAFGKREKYFRTDERIYDKDGIEVKHRKFTWQSDADGYPIKFTVTNTATGKQHSADFSYTIL